MVSIHCVVDVPSNTVQIQITLYNQLLKSTKVANKTKEVEKATTLVIEELQKRMKEGV